MKKRALFIVNPAAGKGRARYMWEQLEKILISMDAEYRCEFTKGPGSATLIVKEQRDDYEVVVSVGGDGTLHEVLNGLVGSNTPLYIVPAGTGNDFATLCHVPTSPIEIINHIQQATTKLVDIGKVGEEYFIGVAGMGFDGAVAQAINQSSFWKRLGSFGYICSVVVQLFTFKVGHVRIEVDGSVTEIKDVWLVAVANGTSYGGGMKICPQAKVDDQLFDICIVSGISRWELLRVFPKVFSGEHLTHPAVHLLRGNKVLIASDRSFVVHADGEIKGITPMQFKIASKKLKIMI